MTVSGFLAMDEPVTSDPTSRKLLGETSTYAFDPSSSSA